jgi:hypothetical protein
MIIKFYPAAFRKKVYRSIEELQIDLTGWIRQYNYEWDSFGQILLREDAGADVH